MQKQSCANCRFWGEPDRYVGDRRDCRKRCPSAVMSLDAQGRQSVLTFHPRTPEAHWCGEWEAGAHTLAPTKHEPKNDQGIA